MKRFNNPSRKHRNQPRPIARDLIIGHDNAKDVHRGKASLHIRPVKPNDHQKRYTPGNTLNIRAYVGGPTWCRVQITAANRLPLNQALTLINARLAGHRTTSELRETYERSYGHGRDDRIVWVLHFHVDATEQPRLLAQGGYDGGSYRKRPDGTWQYTQRTDERDSDRGYTSVESRGLRDEMPALSDEDWAKHVHANKDQEHEHWVALNRAISLGERRRAPKHLRKAA